MVIFRLLIGALGLTMCCSSWAQFEGQNLLATYQIEASVSSEAELLRHNSAQLDIADRWETNASPESTRQASLSLAEAESYSKILMKHPVVGMEALSQYEPEDPKKQTGLCFGRAMFLHLLFLARGIHKSSIKKALMVGAIDSGRVTWSYHMATMVRATEGGWWVIDADLGRVVSHHEWYKHWQSRAVGPKPAQIFFTAPERFSAESGTYRRNRSSKVLEVRLERGRSSGAYFGYFTDMLDWFRESKHLKSLEHRGRSCRSVLKGLQL